MALVIASQLRKELSGWQLFDGVSFKVERRDRIALAGPNGAGKTTLLRILNGETDYQGGELVFSKGTRVALHDQRPPLEQGLTLREYVLSGAADLVATERELRDLEHKMAGGQHDPATLRRYSDAQARLEHAGGYAWRDRARRRPLDLVRGPLARLADRESGACVGRREDGRPPRRRHRAARALRRAVPLQEEQGEAGAGEDDPDRAPRARAPAGERRARVADDAPETARLRLSRPAEERPHRDRDKGPRGLRRHQGAAARRRLRARARGARGGRGSARIRQGDAAGDDARATRAGRGLGAGGARRHSC